MPQILVSRVRTFLLIALAISATFISKPIHAESLSELQAQLLQLQQQLPYIQSQITAAQQLLAATPCNPMNSPSPQACMSAAYLAALTQVTSLQALQQTIATQIQAVTSRIAMAQMASRMIVTAGVAAVVTTGVMAGVTTYYNVQMNTANAQMAAANALLMQQAAQQGACNSWRLARNLYLERVDQYNMMQYTCSGSVILSIGSFINYNCYGLTPPVNNVGPMPAGCSI